MDEDENNIHNGYYQMCHNFALTYRTVLDY